VFKRPYGHARASYAMIVSVLIPWVTSSPTRDRRHEAKLKSQACLCFLLD